MQQEPIPGIAYENGLVQRFLPEITLADVNALAARLGAGSQPRRRVSAPKKAGVTVPDEAKLAAVIKSAGGGALTAYVDTVSTAAAHRDAAQARLRREDRDEGAGDHRVDALERRAGRARADHVQAGRDPVPGLQPRRHVARPRSGLRRRRNGGPDRVRGRTRHAHGHRRRQEARGQDRRRASRHRGDVRGAERPGAAPRSRNDVSVDLPDVHAAARRCGSVSRGDGPTERRAGESPGAAGRRVRRRAQRGGHPGSPARAADERRIRSRR